MVEWLVEISYFIFNVIVRYLIVSKLIIGKDKEYWIMKDE